MSQYRKILLIADPSMKLTPAYHRAARLARATGAELYLCVFDYSSAVAAIGVVSGKVAEVLKWDLVKQRELWLRRRAEQLRASGIVVHTDVTWGAPIHERILEKINAVQPDLVVKDVHLEPLLKRVLFTPLDWHLLRLCPSPLLMVRGGARKLPRRVIVAVDTAHPLKGSEALNERIVREGLALATQCDAKLHLVHTFEDLLPVVPGEVINAEAFNDAYEHLREIHRSRFETFADKHGVPAERRHFIYGPSAYSLAEFARHSHSDVLVLGTTHRTGLDRIVIGSTAEDLLADVRCDVLVVKPEGFARDLDRPADRNSHRGTTAKRRPAEVALKIG